MIRTSNPPVKVFGCRVYLEKTQKFFYALNIDKKDYLWDTHHYQVARLQLPLSEKHGLPPAPTGIGTLSFDTQQELLWIGTDSVSLSYYTCCPALSDFFKGRVTSYYGSDLQKYTSVQAHPVHEGRVAQLLFHERGVISLASRSVHLISRRGLTQWHISFVES